MEFLSPFLSLSLYLSLSLCVKLKKKGIDDLVARFIYYSKRSRFIIRLLVERNVDLEIKSIVYN